MKAFLSQNRNYFRSIPQKELIRRRKSLKKVQAEGYNRKYERRSSWSYSKCTREKRKQESKVAWIEKGNLNINFFHLSTIMRRKKNIINLIENEDRNKLSSRKLQSNFSTSIVNYFNMKIPRFLLISTNSFSSSSLK